MFQRELNRVLTERLLEPRRFIQVLAGPRQVGKTTSVTQVLAAVGIRSHYATADEPGFKGPAWIAQQWETARAAIPTSSGHTMILALDEIQKIPGWSEVVKRLWDEDTRRQTDVRVVLLGSSPLLMQHGLTESLAGRFELLRATHWQYTECRSAFGLDLDAFLYYGGYPGGAPLIGQPDRWRQYILDSLIEPTISRDILLLTRVDKPALLRQLFYLACEYSGQIVSYTKLLGQLQDAGNVTTLAHYLNLLASAGLLAPLPKYSGSAVRRRASSPKLQVLNTALLNVVASRTMEEAVAEPEYWGRVVESGVGAYLMARSAVEGFDLYYWRDKGREVDFVLTRGKDIVALEVKSGTAAGGGLGGSGGGRRAAEAGLEAFLATYRNARPLLVGGDGIPLEDFLSGRVDLWPAK